MKYSMNFTRKEFHLQVFYLGLCLLVISLPTSRFMITVSLILLAVNWLAEGNYREKFIKIKSNKPVLAFSGIYLVHLVGLLWTIDIVFALENDLLHKLPTLFLPWIFITTPIPDARKTRLLLFLFIASVLSVSIIGTGISIYKPLIDFRETSPFIPNHYFSLMLILAAFQLPLLIRQINKNRLLLGIGIAVAIWLVYFLLLSRTLSGIVVFSGITLYCLILLIALNKSIYLRVTSLLASVIFIAATTWLLSYMYDKSSLELENDFGSLDELTSFGNSYSHDTLNLLRENGHLVYLYISEEELESAWNERSNLDYQGMDNGNHSLKHTLYRFMASRGLKKDREGLQTLTDEEIRAVENGITNYYYLEWPGFFIRLHQMMKGLYMYRKTDYNNPDWSTLTARIDYWKASIEAFKKYPLFGWGTGSIMQAMEFGNEMNNSAMTSRNMKPHNQYFYTLLSVGLTGFLIIMAFFSYFVLKTGVYKSFIFCMLFASCCIHFLGNHTLESQLGQNFFVLFTLIYAYFYPQLNSEKKFVY